MRFTFVAAEDPLRGEVGVVDEAHSGSGSVVVCKEGERGPEDSVYLGEASARLALYEGLDPGLRPQLLAC